MKRCTQKKAIIGLYSSRRKRKGIKSRLERKKRNWARRKKTKKKK